MNENALLNSIIFKLKEKHIDKDDTLFFARLGANFRTIYRNFIRIYGGRHDYDKKIEQLIEMLYIMYMKRSEILKVLDIKRENNPGWILSSKWAGTMLYVDRFCGKILNLKDKIAYFKELGINYVHLMPVLRSPEGENDGGYAVSNYREIDPKFGTMDDLRYIAEEFRENDMIIVIDLVLNHTADTHEWAKKALAGDKKYQDYFYMFDSREIPDKYEETLPEVFPDLAPGNFTFRPEINKWVFTVFNKYQWDLNYTNPDVFIEMTEVLLNLANQGVDVLRLDAAPFLWKQLGTNSQNEQEVHILLQILKGCAKITAPGVVFKAEAIVQPNDIVKYLGQGSTSVEECEIAYNASYMVFLWDAIATKNVNLLRKGLENMPRIPKGTTWINYVRCHDDIGLGFSENDARGAGYDPAMHKKFLINYYTEKYFGSYAKGVPFMYNPKTGDARISGSLASLAGLEKAIEDKNEDEYNKAIAKIILLHSAIMSFGGIPLIYYGDELAYTNDYSYLEDVTKKDDNRWMHRPVIDWEKAKQRKDVKSKEGRVFSTIKKMIKVRSQTLEFDGENDYEMIGNESRSVFSFLRERNENKTLVLMNFSDTDEYLNADILSRSGFAKEDILYDRYNGNDLYIHGGKIILKPYEFLWITNKK